MPARPANDRAERRRQRAQVAAPPSSRATWLAALPPIRAMPLLWGLVTLTFLVLTALGIERKITWYLAVDQYGYLAFAHDLMHGKVFHHWPPLDAFMAHLPSRVDVLVQTYVYDAGKLYCRYAPGFPMVLAGWLTLFGDDGAHYLNPTIYMALLVLLIAFQLRIFRSAWRATIGTVLVVLFPTTLHLWALTLTRELATYLAAMAGLFLLLPKEKHPLGPGRMAAAGVALGFAGSIRPEALIYLLPALLLAVLGLRRERTGARPALLRLGAGGLAVVVGLTPFLSYNWAATGSPFRPTQGMEIPLFGPPKLPPPPPPPKPRTGFPPGAWRGTTVFSVQGGGLRLAHLPQTLPGNIAIIRASYGDLMLVLALLGALVAAVRRRTLFVATVPYILVALLFYSCWSKPDARYLCGIFLVLPMLIVEGSLGALDLARRFARNGDLQGARSLALGLGALLFIGAWLLFPEGNRGALAALTVIVTGGAGLAAVATGVDPRRPVTMIAAPLLAVALVGLLAWRAPETLQRRASFQRPEMVRARETFNKAVQPGAVVITTEDVGRPAENIDYYSGVARALYFTDLERWRLSVGDAAALLAKAGMLPYLFVPTVNPARASLLEELSSRFTLELAADVPAARSMDYFVAAAFHRGMHMELYRLVPIPR